MKTTDTALLGHVSGEALSAAALSDLWTMCTGVLLQGRILGVLVGQSIGAKNHHIALVYLRISYIILGLLSVCVMISWGLMGIHTKSMGGIGAVYSSRQGRRLLFICFHLHGTAADRI